MYQWTSAEYADSDRNRNTIDAVIRVANDIGAMPAQVSLSWLSDRPAVTAPIIGARTLQHLTEALGAVDLTLNSDSTTFLDAVSAPLSGGYPYEAFGSGQRMRFVDSPTQALKSLVSEGSKHPLGRI
ncbi:hypothetical protein CI15_06320 [Paraburkholderia monticola]|uniref:NADP-dependent oxidoreductase domain-containing protein n=1 Tax=Paraburkholderia monticola TaxID=1399968 RepID=A0A149PXR4_9BURK|nr:aldo/keto reductase [Paraburkholderia monticola]KXU89799.1 hypothetical protein CI15_06320 [Paraburkholderia monticola]